MIISREFKFHTAHKLYHSDFSKDWNDKVYGKCCNTHGHCYRLIVYIKGTVGRDGMVMNFSTIKEVVNKYVVEHLDHKYLNVDIEYFKKNLTTAENIVKYIWDIIYDKLSNKHSVLYKLELYESDECKVEYIGDIK